MFFMHTPGFPVAPSLAVHWLSAVHAPHAFAAQIGFVVTVQSAEVLHWTQMPVVPQTGVVADRTEHALAAAD
jgi:hypothetical protein